MEQEDRLKDYSDDSDGERHRESHRDRQKRRERERDRSSRRKRRDCDDYGGRSDDDYDDYRHGDEDEYSDYYDDKRRSSWRDSQDRDIKNSRDRDSRDSRDRDSRDSRDRDSRDSRDRDSRDSRDRDSRDSRDRDSRDSRDRDSRDSRDRDSRDSRDKDSRDSHDRDIRGSHDSRNSRDRDRDRRDYRDEDHHSRPYGRYERPDKEHPYHTVIIKYLPFNVTECEIRVAVVKHGLNAKDVRVVKNRFKSKEAGSGSSSSLRGFAFVEFDTVAEATHWMEVTQGVVEFDGGYRGIMFYSIPKEYAGNEYRHGAQFLVKSDWNCVNCGAHNFKRRDVCFKCSAEKKDSALYGEGYEEMSSVPTSTLLFRNLDTLTTEDSILSVVSNCATLSIKKIKIAKDNLTGISRGFCYVEMHSVNESMQLYNLLSVPGHPLIIDNKEVSISYACTSATYMPRETSTNIANAALAAAQWSNQASGNTIPSIDPSQFNYSQYYQQQHQQYAVAAAGTAPYSAPNYYQQQPTQPPESTQTNNSDNINTAAAVAQNALQQMQVMKELQKKQIHDSIVTKVQQDDTPEMVLAKQAQQWKQKQVEEANAAESQNPATSSTSSNSQCVVTGNDYTQYPVPDISTYVYDESTGYYYDSTTGLYYDANSQYYYNAEKQIYLYWDGERQTYVPASNDGSTNYTTSVDAQTASDFDRNKNKGKDKQDKVKIAKKIAKDMERWAKTLNQKKETGSKSGTNSQFPSASFSNMQDPNQSASTDICFSMLEKKTTPAERQAAVYEAMKKSDAESQEVGLVAEYGGGSDSDDEESKGLVEKLKQEENKLIDWNKIACLLCKRKFPNKQVLQKHQQMSDLHKQNLETLKRSKFSDLIDSSKDSKYRDRAKERRMKYGEPEPPKNSRLKDIYYKDLGRKNKGSMPSSDYEAPTKRKIGSENIGNKMLKKMGWNEGQGLGRSNQGMTGIIEAQKRNASAGLGMQGGTHGAIAGDSYRDTVKKMMQSRYRELDS